jgi:DNA polymerase III subunit alpha
MITIEDQTGSIEAVVFSKPYAVAGPLLQNDQIVLLRGKVDRRREEPCIVVDEVLPIERAPEQLTEAVRIVLHGADPGANGNGATEGRGRHYNGELKDLSTVLRQSSRGGGRAGVLVEVHQQGQVVDLRLDNLRINVAADLPQRIDTILRSPGSCQLIGPAKLLRSARAGDLLHDDQTPQQPRLQRQTEEVCASIDRY